jgi:hypothetical protein
MIMPADNEEVLNVSVNVLAVEHGELDIRWHIFPDVKIVDNFYENILVVKCDDHTLVTALRNFEITFKVIIISVADYGTLHTRAEAAMAFADQIREWK